MLKEECTVAGKDLVSVATSDLRLRLGLSGDAITIGCPNWGREPRSSWCLRADVTLIRRWKS